MPDQDGRQAADSPLPSPEDTEGRKVYWQVRGQPWRTKPEIDTERQEELKRCLKTKSNIETGRYPFKDVKLNRADIEWLLSTHESGGIRGPVDLSDARQRKREGLDLRGAHLEGEDLSGLPLARIRGGITFDEMSGVAKEQQIEMAVVHLQQADLIETNLQQAILARANLREAKLMLANLQQADLLAANLQQADLEKANLQQADLRRAQLKGARLAGATLGNEQQVGPQLVDCQWGDVNLAAIKPVEWARVKILGDEYVARQERYSWGEIKEKQTRLDEYEEAVRANRQLAVILRNQGINEIADRFAYRAQVLQWHVRHWQLSEQLEEVQPHSQQQRVAISFQERQQEVKKQKANEGEVFNLPGLFAELLNWPSFLLLDVAHPLQTTPPQEIFLFALQLLALLYLVVSPLFLFLFLLISLPFICVWFLELLLALAARVFPGWLAKQGHKQQRLQPLPLPLNIEQFKTSVSSVIRQAGVLLTMFFKTLNVHFSSLGSLLLDLLAGHGYKSGRTIIWYLLTIGGFAWAYFHLGPTEGHLFSPSGALVFSMTSFHGRGFFPGTLSLEDTITKLAAAEAVIGLFIEISFIATFTQRFFGK